MDAHLVIALERMQSGPLDRDVETVRSLLAELADRPSGETR